MNDIDKFSATMRSGGVTRFHTTETLIKVPTDAQHQWGVAAFAAFIRPGITRELLFEALFHDSPELFGGDLTAPFKTYLNAATGNAVDRAEAAFAAQGMFIPGNTPAGLSPLIQIADLLECLRWTFIFEIPGGEVDINASKSAEIRRRLDELEGDFTDAERILICALTQKWTRGAAK